MQTDGSRPVDHYLHSFDRIRQIQDYLVEQADRRGVPVLENTYLDETVRRLVDHTLDVVERVAAERDAAGAAAAGGGPVSVPVGEELRSTDAARMLSVELDGPLDVDAIEPQRRR
jgi:hypothetical protein